MGNGGQQLIAKFTIYQRKTWNNGPSADELCRHRHRNPFRAWRCSAPVSEITSTSIMASDDYGKRWRQLGFDEANQLQAGQLNEWYLRRILIERKAKIASSRTAVRSITAGERVL